MIKKLCFTELQHALYDLLVVSGYNIYDDSPENPDYPYVLFGYDVASDNGTKTFHGDQVITTLHVYSIYHGFKETKDMLDALIQILSEQPISMTTFVLAHRNLESAETLPLETLPDMRVVRHGVLKYRFLIDQK